MTVVQYEQPAPLPASRPGDEALPGPTGRIARLRAAAEYANYVANTAVVPETLRGKPDEVAAVILTGEEVGLEPMAALRSVAMIKGVPTFKAEALRGLVVSKGHELWLEESTVTRAIAAGRRAGSDRVGRVTWTMDDAKRAGIGGQPNYAKYPKEMLVARATAALTRQMFADVVMGLIAAEELEGYEYVANGAEPSEPPPPPPDVTPPAAGGRARRRAPAPASPPTGAAPVTPTPPVDEQPTPPLPPEPLATEAYKRQIFALMRDVGLQTAERDNRLDYTRRVIGRPELASSNELTIGEASRVIEDLKQLKELPPEERAARLAGTEETAVVEALQELTGAAESPPNDADGPESSEAGEPTASEPVPYNEFPSGF